MSTGEYNTIQYNTIRYNNQRETIIFSRFRETNNDEGRREQRNKGEGQQGAEPGRAERLRSPTPPRTANIRKYTLII